LFGEQGIRKREEEKNKKIKLKINKNKADWEPLLRLCGSCSQRKMLKLEGRLLNYKVYS